MEEHHLGEACEPFMAAGTVNLIFVDCWGVGDAYLC
jgi:hypothetical protein